MKYCRCKKTSETIKRRLKAGHAQIGAKCVKSANCTMKKWAALGAHHSHTTCSNFHYVAAAK